MSEDRRDDDADEREARLALEDPGQAAAYREQAVALRAAILACTEPTTD
ncbi:hypothetical protein [Streptomyces sp. VRA16 Mangrove soil]|nr:hypothetical protein [Streptomyces sp. VRA16 Mangrove soil]MBO1337154.1 hypothetical protein [Streptomyces sp. VRA16 Mangrove soil]